MRPAIRTRDGLTAWSLARSLARASPAEPKTREQGLALIAAGLELLEGNARPSLARHALGARRALAGANVHGFGLEIRQVATILEGAVRALQAATATAHDRLRALGARRSLAAQVAPHVALGPVLALARALLATVDAALVTAPSVALEPYARPILLLASGRLVIDGAVAELLRETGALGADRDASRSSIHQRVYAVLKGRRR